MTIGIDLGTTNSAVAWVDGGVPRLLPNRRGQQITPSAVGYDRGGALLVGEAAVNQSAGAPQATAREFKRRMGQRIALPVATRHLSPEELSAELLATLREDAGTFFGMEIRDAVITVPAHFDDRQRMATLEAGMLAGFERLRLLNEPTAAALPYATREVSRERILVFDFGGGTLDVTCLERDRRHFIVRSTAGDGALGGSDIDSVLFDRIARELEASAGRDLTRDARTAYLVRDLAVRAKIELSERSEVTVALPFAGGDGSLAHLEVTLERGELEGLIAPLVDQAIGLAREAADSAGFLTGGFDTLVLAGGSSRIPVIQARLAAEFGVQPAVRINPEEVVAAGAALFGHNIGDDGFVLDDVLSQSLQVELADGSCVPILHRNQTVPASFTRVFTTVADGQAEADIHLLQGDHRNAIRNRSMGRITLTRIEHGERGKPRIAVTVDVNRDGVVTVEATDLGLKTGKALRARSRPETPDRPVAGDMRHYGDSVVRRARRVARRTEPALAREITGLVAEYESGNARREDLIALIEDLILEAVVGALHPLGGGERRAAI